MELHNMKSTPGSRHTKKRVGRGDKTAGRGENGQKSRAGYSKKVGFEGGQNPLYKRIPKRGFKNVNTVEYTVVNIDKISKLESTEITPEVLVEAGIIKPSYKNIKILGSGTIDKAVTVKAHKFSKTAQEAIEKAGGKVELLKTSKQVQAEIQKEAKLNQNK